MAGEQRGRGTEEGTVRVGVLTALPAVLRKFGADPVKVLAELNLDPELCTDPNACLSLAARGRLLARCVQVTGCDHLGLLVAGRGDLHSLGLVGLLVRYSPDVGSALRNLARHFHLHVHGAALALAVVGDYAVLSYSMLQPHVEGVEQAGDGAVAMLLNTMRVLCGPDWLPVEARFARRRPKDVGPYRRFFRVPTVFDADQYALVFTADCLERPVSDIDPELRSLLQKEIDRLEAEHGNDFPEQVRIVLRTALPAAHAGADQVAALFSMHRRTLCRRLTASGTSFRQLVDETRFEVARQLLESSEIEVSQIAAVLDYAEPSVFTRAFRRWSGTTPALWRNRHREGLRRDP